MKEAGILLHISSLPNSYGIGSLGKEAYKFVDFLKRTGQHIWQILPIGPTSYGDSPYASLSCFAFNPYFIDLDLLVEDGLLKKEDLPYVVNNRRVDYGWLFNTRYEILYKAFLNRSVYEKEFNKFVKENAYWLEDYALFMVLKKEHDNKAWIEWYDDFKYKRPESLEWARNEFKDKILAQKFYQFLFYKQFMALKKYANQNGVSIMGDIPIYTAFDSCDVWSNPSNFLLDQNLNPTVVAGCPPDGFTEFGQLWGNPIYNWQKMEEDNFSWWVKRVKHSLKLFDYLRIDHFRGFAGYYCIPFGMPDARIGEWRVGPGWNLFKEINKECKNAKIVAENLGFLTPDVNELLDKCGYPGMIITEFEFNDGINVPLEGDYKENNVIYPGTHDNQTIISWYYELDEKYHKAADKACGIKFGNMPNLKMIETCFSKSCNMAIISFQDYLGLPDNVGRMNAPSTATGNWQFRTVESDYSKGLENYILKITKKYNRC